METKSKKYYPIDAYYSYKDNNLHYIVKEVDEDGNEKKITGYKHDPEYKIKLAKFTKQIVYTLPEHEAVKELKLTYKDYNKIKTGLASAYEGKKDIKLLNKFSPIMSFQYDIYNDYKLETQFLQKEIFQYDDDYLNHIKMGIFDIEILHDDKEFPSAEEAKYQINSISHIDLQNNNINIYFLYNELHHDKIKDFDNKLYKVLKEKYGTEFTYKIHKFKEEKKLILDYLKYISNFDVMIGWNSLNFDTLYIYVRCKILNILGAFSDSFGELYQVLNIVDSKQGMQSFTYYTTKILSFDYINLIKFYSRVNYPSYSLNRIAEKVLRNDENSITAKIEVANLNIEYLENPINFINYNVGDTILNKFIDDKLLFVKILFKQKMMTRGFSASILSINNILDAYIATEAKKNKVMCISAIKVQSFYTKKVWNIYRRLNFLNDSRLDLIQKLREDNKTFSLFTNEEELNEVKYNIYNDLTEKDLENTDLNNIKLTKGQFPFIWNHDKYPGAYVKNPDKGIHLNVIDFDAEAMYPSSIYSTNNGCDTWIYQVPENLALLYLYERENFMTFVKDNENLTIEIYDVLNDTFKKFKHVEIIEIFKKVYEKELVLTEAGAIFLPAHIKESFFRKLIRFPISDRQSIKKEMNKKIKEQGLLSDDPEILNLNVSQLVDKIIANCFTGDTDFITTNGICNIKDAKIGTKVYNVNPITNEVEIDKIVDIQEYDYNDHIYNFSNTQGLDLSVTKDHRFLVNSNTENNVWKTAAEVYSSSIFKIPKIKGCNYKTNNSEFISLYNYILKCKEKYGFDYDIVISSDLHLTEFKSNLSNELNDIFYKYGRYHNKKYFISIDNLSESNLNELNNDTTKLQVMRKFNKGGRNSKIPIFINKNYLQKLLAYYISEGSLYKRYVNNKLSTLSITITKYDSNIKKQIKEICDNIGINCSINKKDIKICNDILYLFIKENCGKGSYNKKIPKFILNSSVDIKKNFFNILNSCDGNKNIKRYNTVSKNLVNDLIILLTSLGYFTKYKKELYKNKYIYRIVWYNKNVKLDNRINKTKEKYNGKVYCVTTENNKNIFAGRNGKFITVGQSVYGYLGFRRSRLFNIILATTITMNCQFMIRYVAINSSKIIENVK